MAQPYQQSPMPFGNGGIISKVEPGQLQPGQYQRLKNVVSLQEGAIVSRNGYRRINTSPVPVAGGGFLNYIHTLGRLAIGSDETKNFRYIGNGQDIYRVPAIDNPPFTFPPQVSLGSQNFGRMWMQVAYRKFSSGLPYAYFSTPSLMVKDVLTDNFLQTLQPFFKWGIDRPVTPARVTVGVSSLVTSAGNCNIQNLTVIRTGGSQFNPDWPSGTIFNSGGSGIAISQVIDPDHLVLELPFTPAFQVGVAWSVIAAPSGPNSILRSYSYVYTFRNPNTGAESNPSMIMSALTGVHAPINAFNQPISVTISQHKPAGQLPNNVADAGTVDPQIAGGNSVAIYRAGGSFADAFYRRVGFLTADGTTGDLPPFIDTNSDRDIAGNPISQFDNDPPVTSSLPLSFSATINTFTTGPVAAGINKFTVTVNSGFGLDPTTGLLQTQLSQVLRPGTVISVGIGPTQEFCVLWAITGALEMQVWCQLLHSANEPVQTDSVANQPCNLAALAFDSVFLAGDTNNPTFLYKSKTGQPEAFPVSNLEDGSPGSIEVGTPSNPIMAITEFNGEIVCLNKSNIFVVQVWNGFMQAPIITPATRGLFGNWAWCKTDNEIWYLSYDGVYSWNGGQSVKRSEAIDPMFKGEVANGYQPISFSTVKDSKLISDLDRIQFYYWKNEVLILARDIQGNDLRLRYHTQYNRWSIDNLDIDAGIVPVTQHVEEDTGNLLLATAETVTGNTFAFLNQDDTPATSSSGNNTDGWSSPQHDNGQPITMEVHLPFFTMGSPTLQKQFGDVVLEFESDLNIVNVQTFYDFSLTADPIDIFAIPFSSTGRRRFVMSLKSGSAQEAYAVSFTISAACVTPVILYSLTFNYLVLENIQTGRALDWDTLGHPYDKRLKELYIEFDTQGQVMTLNMDTMSGIKSGIESQAVQSFTLQSPVSTTAIGPVRSCANFAINDGTIVKAIRLRPTVTSNVFKIWNYRFDAFNYPADTVLFTDWEDGGWQGDKIYREVTLDVDTLSCSATVNVQIDGVTRATFQVRTSSIDRKRILTMPSNVIGKMHRLLVSPDPAGKFQLFAYNFVWIKEPYGVLNIDSYEQAHETNAFKFLKQVWVDYRCESSVTFKIYRDNNQLLLSTTLPQHLYRNVERFYLPPISSLGVLNKSKTFRYVLTPCNVCAPIFLYVDSSRVEFGVLAGDQRQGYQQFPIYEAIPVPVP